MSTLDEHELARRQIERLRERGEALSLLPGADKSAERTNWVRDVCETIRVLASTDSYLINEADKLWRAPGKSDAFLRAENLLNGLDWRVGLDKRYAISNDFKTAVSIAIKDQYFKSWPFQVIVTIATAIGALLIGGSVYAGFRVDGVLKDISDRQTMLARNAAEGEAKFREFSVLIEERKSKIDEIVRAALTANNSEIAKIFDQAHSESSAFVNETKAKLNAKQTDLMQALDRELRERLQEALRIRSAGLTQDAKNLSAEWGAAGEKLNERLVAAKSALETAKIEKIAELEAVKSAAVKALNEAKGATLESMKMPIKVVDDEKAVAISTVKAKSTTARNEISTFEAEVSGRRDEALRLIQAGSGEFKRAIEDGRKTIAEEIATLPNDVKMLSATMVSVDQALSRHQIGLAALIQDVGSEQHSTRLRMVADVLGLSFWLVIGSFASALLATIILIIVLVRGRRPMAVG